MRSLPAFVLLALTACGTNGPTDTLADQPPVITLGSVQATPILSGGTLVGASATIAIVNRGGPGAWLLAAVADSARGKPCLMKFANQQVRAVGVIASGETKSLGVTTDCTAALDFIVLYGGTGESIKMPAVGCYALRETPCPALATLVIP